MDELCRLNGLSDRDIIREGMVLKLPAKTSSTPARVAAKAPVATGGHRTVTIRSGETLSLVLDREVGTYKRSIAAVKRLNPDLDLIESPSGSRSSFPSPRSWPPRPQAPRFRARPPARTRASSPAQPRRSIKYVVR